MATVTLSGPRVDVIELLEELVEKIRDEDDDPSISIMPNAPMDPALYIEYDASDADEADARVLYEYER